MRNAFAEELVKMAEADPRVVLLSGDIGNKLFDEYKKKFSSRFFNCGVAEANMASMGAGLALSGLRPITYTITSFNTTRCLEQIRVDIAYHKAPVIIVGVGSGLSYATLGATHHTCEDISFLRSIPNMTVVCPGDANELRSLLWDALKINGPVYIRMGKKGEPKVYEDLPKVKIGKAHIVKPGKEICILVTGNLLPMAVEIGNQIEAQVVSFHTVKPLDIASLAEYAQKFSLLVTLEEHSRIGGLGSAVAEWMVDHQIPTKLLRFGTGDEFPKKTGSQEYLREYFGLTPQNIIKTIKGAYAYSSCDSG